MSRPSLPPEKRLEVVTLRLNRSQRETLRRIGVAKLREWLDAKGDRNVNTSSTAT